MVQLFLTQVCDYCDYGVPKDRLHRGFVVYRDPGEAREPRLIVAQSRFVSNTGRHCVKTCKLQVYTGAGIVVFFRA